MKFIGRKWMLLAVLLAACEMSEPDSPIFEEAADESASQSSATVEGGEDGADILACVRSGSRTPFLRADCSDSDNAAPPHPAIACCSGRATWQCPGEGEAAGELCVN